MQKKIYNYVRDRIDEVYVRELQLVDYYKLAEKFQKE